MPDLKVVMEHITTKDAVDYVKASTGNLGATITTHHLIINRNHILAGGIKPRYSCLPVAPRETHRPAHDAPAADAYPPQRPRHDTAPPHAPPRHAPPRPAPGTGHAGTGHAAGARSPAPAARPHLALMHI